MAVVVVQSLISCASTHRVKYSVAMMIYRVPIFPGALIGPIKLIAHFSNDF